VTTTLRRLAAAPSRVVLGAYVPARTATWPDHSRLFVVGDGVGWSIDDDRDRLSATARRLGHDVPPPAWARFVKRQSVFHHDHFGALRPRWLDSSHRLGLSYFHGRPGTRGHPEFDAVHDALVRSAARIDRVQVTHAEMHELVVGAGVAPEKVFRIPIGIDLDRFPLGDESARRVAREQLGVPASAFVLGSFVKDGVGLGEGNEPKLVKGPDVLVATLERLHEAIPELFVLLSGPARGYVRRGLERAGIAYRHVVLPSRDELARAYHALDVYVVASRQEGGPKSALESMATGVPLVSTRVGQVPEIVRDGETALLADPEDVDALAAAVRRIHDDASLRGGLVGAARPAAERYAEERLDERWAALLDGFVDRAG
jgi:glycosyltransferase involved in cell wall biosynthesis